MGLENISGISQGESNSKVPLHLCFNHYWGMHRMWHETWLSDSCHGRLFFCHCDFSKVKPCLKPTREERRVEEILQSKYKFRER